MILFKKWVASALLMPAAIHRRNWRPRFVVAGTAVAVLAGLLFLYNRRFDHPVLYYYGASPEVPHGTAMAILNPFRDRKDEVNAEWLIRDLRTEKCQQIVRERLGADPAQVCPVLRGSTRASLIWLDPERDRSTWARSRDLFYDLPESRSRLVVSFGNSEVGWGVNTISLIR
jgi:hypothetical protein